MKFKTLINALLASALTICLPVQATTMPTDKQKANGITAFVNVNVVPMDKERVLEGQTVVVRDGRIAEIGAASKVKIPHGATRIEGRGKYLMPGLVDMHAHLYAWNETPLYLANGVTTIYNLNGRPVHLAWRDRINRGELLGPTIYTCGPTIRRAERADEARRMVEEQARAGYDSIKIYNNISVEAYEALIETARQHKMLIVGHIPRAPGLEGVLKAKQSIAHAEEYVYTFFKNNVDDESRLPEAVAMTRDAGVQLTLTFVAFEHIIQQVESLPALIAKPEMRYMAPWVRAEWSPGSNPYNSRFDADGLVKLKKSFALQKKLAKALHAAGVRIVTGTDAMNPGVVPGFSINEELQHLVALGFTPFEAIQAATSYPAEFLAGAGEFGTVTTGKRADLILVDGNPLQSVANIERRAGVMTRGRWLPETELRRMLEDVPAAYARDEQFVKTKFETDTASVLRFLDEQDPYGSLANKVVTDIINAQGYAQYRKIYDQLRKNYPSATLVQENAVNALGYRLLGLDKKKEAIEIFKLNVEAYPQSANAYDSLAEGYMLDGDKELSIKFYKKALEIDPNFSNSIQMLKKLEVKNDEAQQN
ncbi:MAG TPA: amidohydrolase family protein [Pyrinomonadaceae bacterium]